MFFYVICIAGRELFPGFVEQWREERVQTRFKAETAKLNFNKNMFSSPAVCPLTVFPKVVIFIPLALLGLVCCDCHGDLKKALSMRACTLVVKDHPYYIGT